jgi:hypothetical protein
MRFNLPKTSTLKLLFNIPAYPENRLWQAVSDDNLYKSTFFPCAGKCFLQKVKIFDPAGPKRGV